MKVVVALFATVCAVVGLMVPLLPADGVTVQLERFAEQGAVEPPPAPVQFQFHGPVPVTELAVPALHRLVVGADVKLPPLAVPHTPFWPNVAATVQFAVIALVVYVKGAVPLAGEPPQVPPTVAV